MSELEWLYIVKINDIIQFKTSLEADYLQIQYGILTKCIVKDADDKICDNCKINELKNIKEGEVWICLCSSYFCHLCFPKVKPRLELFIEQKQNLQKKIPHQLKDVKSDIQKHSQYVNLDFLTKLQYETCIDESTKKSFDNNKYIRALWFHLYHGKEMPIG